MSRSEEKRSLEGKPSSAWSNTSKDTGCQESGCVQELEESENGPTINTSKDEQGDFDNDDVDIDVDIITIDDHNLMSL